MWEALNDPEILRQSIPGCESFEQLGDNRYRATVATRIGPVQARFQGNVQITDIDAAERIYAVRRRLRRRGRECEGERQGAP